MVRLAQDTIAVAEPALEHSPALTSEDLVAIASTASMEHLGAIAGRVSVDEAVTSVLVDRGDAKVLSKVAENQGAEFADAAFLKLVEKKRGPTYRYRRLSSSVRICLRRQLRRCCRFF
ncbi:DUF2336 domain-containing protein [Roseibium salinum]|nr:DUF2336 domain-containing protein [Roseibium salinum]